MSGFTGLMIGTLAMQIVLKVLGKTLQTPLTEWTLPACDSAAVAAHKACLVTDYYLEHITGNLPCVSRTV